MSMSSVVMIFNYSTLKVCRIDCIVYCGGGGVVMERFIGAINRISGDHSQDNSINAFDQ